MNSYTITFGDGSQVVINGATPDEAIRTAQEVHGKPVASISNEHTVEVRPLGSFESMKNGGPNL